MQSQPTFNYHFRNFAKYVYNSQLSRIINHHIIQWLKTVTIYIGHNSAVGRFGLGSAGRLFQSQLGPSWHLQSLAWPPGGWLVQHGSTWDGLSLCSTRSLIFQQGNWSQLRDGQDSKRKSRGSLNTQICHTITSAAFYWPKQITRPVKTQGKRGRKTFNDGGAAKSYCKGHGYREE